jgi:hypothetical protein
MNCSTAKNVRIILILLSSAATVCASDTYFVDPAKGNDHNQGKSIHQAWKTLGKINRVTFEPGDKILFKRGHRYQGSLHLKGSGKAGQPITLGAYGTGRRPVIDAKRHNSAVELLDASYWLICDVETRAASRQAFSQDAPVTALL